jgi:serine/threonine protein kinase
MADTPTTLREGRFTILRVLGEGSQASTFEATDAASPKRVTVKRFRVRGAKSWKEVELAEREARVLASLSHPGIPRYIDHFEEGGELFLVTEMITGESLADLRKAGRSLDEADVIRFLRDAASALTYLHGRTPPIIHRDIKPSNVILRPDGGFSLIDFGAVRDRMKPEGGSTVVGTFGFMAPEQFQGRALAGSDVYAVGATAITLLTGRQPEELPHRGLGIDVEAALRGTGASRAMIKALAAMLEPDPDKRPSKLAPLLAQLDRASGGATPSAQPSPSRSARKAEREVERERRRAQRHEAHLHRLSRIPGLIIFLMILALTIAEVAVALTLRVMLPLLFSILSLAFGKSWRAAAANVSRAGVVAGDAIRRARTSLETSERDDPTGIRVTEVEGVRVPDEPANEADREAEEEARAEAEAEPRPRARRL